MVGAIRVFYFTGIEKPGAIEHLYLAFFSFTRLAYF